MPQWIVLAILLVSAGLGAVPAADRLFEVLKHLLDRLSRRSDLAIAGVGVVCLAVAATISLSTAVPLPNIHDEFSYLLAADTFAHGRLSNPPHAMAEHFETMHVLQHPTYASKYPPGQGMALVVGLILSGDPIVGVWLSTALACAAVCWMLYAWVPGRWALLGGLLLALHGQVLDWSQTYWGGAVAMGGGALVAGALRRLVTTRNKGASPPYVVSMALVLGFGLAIMANSRPYEGLVLSLPLGGFLLVWLIRSYRTNGVILWQVVLPLAMVLGLTAMAMGYYNWRVTGRALLMPYTLHDSIYSRTPHFAWGELRPRKVFGNKEQDLFQNGREPLSWLRQRSLETFGADPATRSRYLAEAVPQPLPFSVPSFARECAMRLGEVARLTASPLALLLLLSRLWRVLGQDSWMRLALLTAAVFAGGLMIMSWTLQTRYTAPAVAIWLALLVACLRCLSQARWRGLAVGRGAAAAIVLLSMGAGVVAAWQDGCYRKISWSVQRARIINTLRQQPGNHLVLVRYLPGHNVHEEWVYNGAEIDAGPVVFARELGAPRDRALLEYYKGRQVWRLEAGEKISRLDVYRAEESERANRQGTVR